MFFYRESNARLTSLEKQSSTPPIPPIQPPNSTPKPGHLPPQQLFYTPRGDMPPGYGVPLTPSTPATPLNSSRISDVESLDSNDTTTVTPEFSKMKLGRGRGRPRKELKQPTVDDFPKDGTDEEKDKYIRKKTTELWRFKKLTSSSSAEYRAKENARVKEYLRNRKGKGKNKSGGDESTTSNDEEGERKRQLSRAR